MPLISDHFPTPFNTTLYGTTPLLLQESIHTIKIEYLIQFARSNYLSLRGK